MEWVIIGFGVRGIPEFTDMFEQLVNATREIALAARMGFTVLFLCGRISIIDKCCSWNLLTAL